VLLLDVHVHVCIYAFRRESRRHKDVKTWLEQALSEPEPVGLPEQVLASTGPLVTNHRIYQDPSTPRRSCRCATHSLRRPPPRGCARANAMGNLSQPRLAARATHAMTSQMPIRRAGPGAEGDLADH
jgi:predicted nucleic acid-binding protein